MSNVLGMDQFLPGGHCPDFSGVDGQAIAQEVQKALQVSGTLPRTGQTDIDALGIEELSGTLASAEIRERQLHFWRDIPKTPAFSMVSEWSRVDEIGDSGEYGFIGHTDSGVVTDPKFYRGSKEIKFLAVKGEVSLPTQLVKLVGFQGIGQNAMDTSEELKMIELLRHAERNLFYARDDLDGIQWSGIFQQIDAAATAENLCRLDMRGAPADKDLLERLGQVFANNSADPTHVYLSNYTYRDLRQSLFPSVRIGENFREGAIGAAFSKFLIEEIGGDADYMKLRRTQMLTRGVRGGLPLLVPTATPSANAPAAPTSVTLAASAHTATSGKPGLDAGTYTYWVTAVGQGGRSAAVASGNQAATAGQKITLTINHAAPATVLFYEIFRIPVGDEGAVIGKARFMDRVTCGGDAAKTYADNGYSIPGTSDMGVFQLSYDEVLFDQLLPVVKRTLPRSAMSNSYVILMFGTPIVKVPIHNVHVVNVGERAQGGVAGI